MMNRLASVPWMILFLLGVFSLARGVFHYLAPDSGAGIVAGMDLSFPNGADIVFMLGAVGVMQMALGVFYIWFATKGREFLQFALVVEFARSALFVVMEYSFKMPADPVPGRYAHIAVFLLVTLALAVHLWVQHRSPSVSRRVA